MEAYVIPEIKALKKQQENDRAEKILHQIADQVLPIMAKYKWKVRRLHEFFPKDNRLLGMNVNRGAKILVRLRPAHDAKSFYPYTEVLGTMLHELVHMRISPHDDTFYKLLEELKRETESLMMRNITGLSGAMYANVGGQSLGGQRSSGSNFRDVAGKAALKRQRLQGLSGSGSGRRLGGQSSEPRDTTGSALSKREILLHAAERRKRDDQCCAALLNGLNIHDPHQDSPKPKPSGKKNTSPVIYTILDEEEEKEKTEHVDEWICSNCTFRNHTAKHYPCEICSSVSRRKHHDQESSESCPHCTYINLPGSQECDMCQTKLNIPASSAEISNVIDLT